MHTCAPPDDEVAIADAENGFDTYLCPICGHVWKWFEDTGWEDQS